MTKVSNVSLIALGLAEVREGTAISEGGIARLAEGIVTSWITPVRWSYGVGDNEVAGCTSLGDMFKGRRHLDGSDDGKFLPAMYRAVAENFGIDGEFTSADKVAFRRGFAIAAAVKADVPIKFVDAKVERKGRSATVRAVQVPASVAFKLSDEGGAPTDLGKEMISRVKSNLELEGKDIPDDSVLLKRAGDLKVNCVGGKHPVLGKVPSSTVIASDMERVAIDRGMLPPKVNRDRAAQGDKFVASLDFVIKCFDDLAGNDDEAGFGASDALESKLREVAERIAAYFAA